MSHTYNEDHELSMCVICKLYEGALTTDCSGENSISKSDDIYNGELDYRVGEGWVNKLNPTNQIWVKGKIINFLNGWSKYESENEFILASGISKQDYRKYKSELLKETYEND